MIYFKLFFKGNNDITALSEVFSHPSQLSKILKLDLRWVFVSYNNNNNNNNNNNDDNNNNNNNNNNRS